MRGVKFRLIENDKIVGYEKHSRSGSEGLKVFHSILNDDSEGWEWWNTNDITKWIKHDNKEQYTGKKDKNGKDIYAGDNVEESLDGIIADRYGTIIWNDEELCWDLGGFGLGEFDISDIEIIGNIHEQ